EDHRAVTLRNHAAVQQHDRPHVRAAADQAAESLLELQGRIGDEVVREAVQTARLQLLQPRRRERLRRYLEGQLRENQHPQRAPWYVDALPERVRSKQNPRACLPEASQQVVALPFALHEQGPPAADRAAHRLRRPAQRRMAREQHEHAAVRCVGQLHEYARDGGAVARFVVPRLGEIGGNPEQTLRGVIERRCMDLTHLRPRRRQVEPEPFLEIAEVSARRENASGGLSSATPTPSSHTASARNPSERRSTGAGPGSPSSRRASRVNTSSAARRAAASASTRLCCVSSRLAADKRSSRRNSTERSVGRSPRPFFSSRDRRRCTPSMLTWAPRCIAATSSRWWASSKTSRRYGGSTAASCQLSDAMRTARSDASR